MGLTKIPTRTDDSLGRQKYDQMPATDLETQISASEYNATADAVIAVSEAVGLADGSTPGSLEARMADALSRLDDAETCCATNGDRLDVIEPKVATLEADGDKQARQRLDALEPEVQDHEQRIATLEQEPGGVDQYARGRLDVLEPQVAALEEQSARMARATFIWDAESYVMRDGHGIGGAWWSTADQAVMVAFDGLGDQTLVSQVFISRVYAYGGSAPNLIFEASPGPTSDTILVKAFDPIESETQISEPFDFNILVFVADSPWSL